MMVRARFSILGCFALLRMASATHGAEDARSFGAGQAVLKENLDLPENDKVLQALEEDETIGIVFAGQYFEGSAFFFCVDRSGSTRNGALERSKQTVLRTLVDLSATTEFGVAFYDSGLRTYPDLAAPARGTERDKAAAGSFVLEMQPGSGSCVSAGLVACLDFAAASRSRHALIFYLGDGCTSCPGHDPEQYAAQTLALFQERNVAGARVVSLVVGPAPAAVKHAGPAPAPPPPAAPPPPSLCEEFPRQLAAITGGTYVRVTR